MDSEEKFLFLRDFMLEIEPMVRRHSGWYYGFDLLLLEAVTSCATYEEFLSRYGVDYVIGFTRNVRKAASKPKN